MRCLVGLIAAGAAVFAIPGVARSQEVLAPEPCPEVVYCDEVEDQIPCWDVREEFALTFDAVIDEGEPVNDDTDCLDGLVVPLGRRAATAIAEAAPAVPPIGRVGSDPKPADVLAGTRIYKAIDIVDEISLEDPAYSYVSAEIECQITVRRQGGEPVEGPRLTLGRAYWKKIVGPDGRTKWRAETVHPGRRLGDVQPGDLVTYRVISGYVNVQRDGRVRRAPVAGLPSRGIDVQIP